MDWMQDDYAFFQELIDSVPGESESFVENRTQTLSRTELQARLDAKISEAKEKAAKNAPIIPEKSEKPLKPTEKAVKTSEKPSKTLDKPSKTPEKQPKTSENPHKISKNPSKPSKKSPKAKQNKLQSI